MGQGLKDSGSNPGFGSVRNSWSYQLRNNWLLYVFVLPTILFYVIFHYVPMYGAVIAFKNFIPFKGIMGSPWVGFEHFERFFQGPFFDLLIRNTLIISVYTLIATFPIPIIFALMLNQVEYPWFRKTLQTSSYIPYFISMVVYIAMVFMFLSPSIGLINRLIMLAGGEAIHFMNKADWFYHVYVATDVWKETGFAAIIYIAVLSTINPELHEAALVDGATKLQRIFYIDIPGIVPTAVILLILRVGRLMDIGFEKAYLLQTELNIDASEIIPTYVYKAGLIGAQFSYSSAIGLFNSVINLVLILVVNQISKKVTGNSLW